MDLPKYVGGAPHHGNRGQGRRDKPKLVLTAFEKCGRPAPHFSNAVNGVSARSKLARPCVHECAGPVIFAPFGFGRNLYFDLRLYYLRSPNIPTGTKLGMGSDNTQLS